MVHGTGKNTNVEIHHNNIVTVITKSYSVYIKYYYYYYYSKQGARDK
jgi:hypothetical protein